MTAWYNITEAETDPGAPPKSELWKAWWKNPIAIAEGTIGAPYAQTSWHPYNGTNVGDSGDGIIFDHSIDGSVAIVISPDFLDGYEYGFLLDAISTSGTGNMQISLFRESAAAYTTAQNFANSASASQEIRGFFYFPLPRTQRTFFSLSLVFATEQSGSVIGANPTFTMTADTILRVRFDCAVAGNFDSGRIKMLRRRVFA